MTVQAPARAGALRGAGSLPVSYRVAALARRAIGPNATRAVSRSRIANPLRHALSLSAPAGISTVEICGGLLQGMRMDVDLRCEKYYWLGTHEEPLQRLIAERIRPGDVVFDAGAHAGFFTLLFAMLAGPFGRVVACEPVPANAERLRANLAANELRNTDVRQLALSDRDGEATFALHPSTLEGAIAEPGAGLRTIAVRTATVDALLDHGAPPPRMIKIDVEGSESAVIRGARRTLTAHRPDLLLEVHSDDAGRDVLAALPVPYEFTAIGSTRITGGPLTPGHYLGVLLGE